MISQEWVALCEVDDLEPGAMLAVNACGRDIAVVRVGEQFFAIDGICTHALGFLDEGRLIGYEVECPLHEGRFDVRDGQPTAEPAQVPLGCYTVTIDNNTVMARLQGE